MKQFWTGRRIEAAQLVAQDRIPDAAIAAKLGISRATLALWKCHPEFAARVAEQVGVSQAAALKRGIAVRDRRVTAMHARWQALNQIIAERAQDPALKRVPGGSTGLLRAVGDEQWAVDADLLRELRELEKQAAQELGQWAERHEHAGPGGAAIPLAVSYLDDLDPLELRVRVDEARAYIAAGVLPDDS